MKSYSDYKDLFNDVYNNFIVILNELEKIYPIQKISPNYKPYLAEYSDNVSNLQKSQDSLISAKNSLKMDLITLNKEIGTMNIKLSQLDKENDILLRINDDLDVTSGAPGELKQRVYLYNQAFVQNIVLFLALCGFIGLFVKIFPKDKASIINDKVSIIKDAAVKIGEAAVEKGSVAAQNVRESLPSVDDTAKSATKLVEKTIPTISSETDTKTKT